MPTRPCNLLNVGAIGSAKTALQATAGPFSQNRLLLSLTPSSAVMNHCRRTRAAGSIAEGSPRARPAWEQRPVILKPRRSRPAGSIGLRGGSYCWRASSARGWQAGSRQRTICCNRHRPFSRQQNSRVANPADNKLSSRQITNMPKPSSPRSGYLNRPQSLRRP